MKLQKLEYHMRAGFKPILAVFVFVILIVGCHKPDSNDKESGIAGDLAAKFPAIDQLWDWNSPTESEHRFLELLKASEGKAGKDYELELMTQIARAQGMSGNFDEAHRTLDRVESELTQKAVQTQIRYLLERGRIFNSAGIADSARHLFANAWELAKSANNDLYAVDAAHMLGIVEDPENALKWNLSALDIVEKSSDARIKGWLGPMYNNIGWTYHDLADYNRALELFEKGVNWRSQAEGDSAMGTRIARWTVARCLRSLGRSTEAMKMQLELLDLNEFLGNPSGYVYEELGELYLLLNDEAKSAKHFAQAWQVLSNDQWLMQNEIDRMQRIKKLARLKSNP
jgi:tetratricopeptide (TPR) repeat protein